VHRDTNTDTPIPPDEPMAPNPPEGALIDYYLSAPAKSVTLEILDGQNHLVRRFSNTERPDITEEELKKQLIPLYWVRNFKSLSTEAGMHRWEWHLRYPAPASSRHEYPIAAIPHDTPRLPLGPTVVPGTYTVRLTVDGKVLTAPLTVKMDPRIKTSPAGLQKKFEAETRLATMMTQTNQALTQGGAIRAQLEKVNDSSKADVKNAVGEFQKKLGGLIGTPGGFFAPPSQEVTLGRVNGEAGTLYQQIWQVDAEPTTSQNDALSATEKSSTEVLKRWADFKNTELPALNRLLRDAQVPEVNPEADFHPAETSVDEE
jgi:hypothetical protein